MEPQAEAFRFHGHNVVDSVGQKVGRLEALYIDVPTEEPRWAAVLLDGSHAREAVVPLAGAKPVGDDLRVDFTKPLIEASPTAATASLELPVADQEALSVHYSLAGKPVAWGPPKRWP